MQCCSRKVHDYHYNNYIHELGCTCLLMRMMALGTLCTHGSTQLQPMNVNWRGTEG